MGRFPSRTVVVAELRPPWRPSLLEGSRLLLLTTQSHARAFGLKGAAAGFGEDPPEMRLNEESTDEEENNETKTTGNLWLSLSGEDGVASSTSA